MMNAGNLRGPRHEVALGDEAYPDRLLGVPEPPKRLYAVGNLAALAPGLAVIGARKATPYGLGCARRFAGIAAAKGVNVISGGARGCDSQAHRAALDQGGTTAVVLGGGCDEVYPPEHLGLFQRVVDAGGVVLSERPWGFKPLPYTFRARNRIIAGLADAVLIVEAGLPSGTFSTADNALESGRDVLVVPGSITSPESRGSNRLLLQGAVPVVDDESFEDALFNACGMLRWSRPDAAAASGDIDPVVEAAMAEPLPMDDLLRLARDRFGADAQARLMELLVEAEAAGLLARRPDGKWGPVVGGSP